MKKISKNRSIGAGCCVLGGFGPLGGTLLKDWLPYSGIIGWSFGIILIFCGLYFFGKKPFVL